jgi:hypothetical protein
MDNLPVVHEKLQRLRRAAKALADLGFEDQAIELMRISRGEVKIKPRGTLFGMSPAELDNARSCAKEERKRWAAFAVLMRKQVESEDETMGPQGWPKGRKKDDMIAEAAKDFDVPPSSLERHMKGADCSNDFKSGSDSIAIRDIHPDWHPDKDKELFGKG